jgi:hypothetical protein
MAAATPTRQVVPPLDPSPPPPLDLSSPHPLDLRDVAVVRVSVSTGVLFYPPFDELEGDGLGLEQPAP